MYGDLFPNRVTMDIEARDGVTVDIIADAHDLHMIDSESFDVVLCTEVLEHLHSPAKAISEFHRVLKTGGVLIITTRFIFPLHDTPNDFFRFTKYGLKELLKEFEIKDFVEESNTIETLAVMHQRIGFQCDTLWLKPFKIYWFITARIIMLLSRMITSEYGDIGHKKKEKNILSSGYYVSAVKQ